MEDRYSKIIHESMDLFLKYGIRSMTMDDISRELGISKKTLYKFVSNKADLVEQGVKSRFDLVTNGVEEIRNKFENSIDELFEIDAFLDSVIKTQDPSSMFQLSKYYPETFKWLQAKKSNFIMTTTRKNLEKGIKQGMYRNNLNVDFISYIYVAHTNIQNFESGLTNKICESPEFHHHHLHYHIRGIASAEGLSYLNQKLK